MYAISYQNLPQFYFKKDKKLLFHSLKDREIFKRLLKEVDFEADLIEIPTLIKFKGHRLLNFTKNKVSLHKKHLRVNGKKELKLPVVQSWMILYKISSLTTIFHCLIEQINCYENYTERFNLNKKIVQECIFKNTKIKSYIANSHIMKCLIKKTPKEIAYLKNKPLLQINYFTYNRNSRFTLLNFTEHPSLIDYFHPVYDLTTVGNVWGVVFHLKEIPNYYGYISITKLEPRENHKIMKFYFKNIPDNIFSENYPKDPWMLLKNSSSRLEEHEINIITKNIVFNFWKATFDEHSMLFRLYFPKDVSHIIMRNYFYLLKIKYQPYLTERYLTKHFLERHLKRT